MKKADLKFKDEDRSGYSSVGQCIFNEYNAGYEKENQTAYLDFLKRLLRQAADTDDFVSRYLDKETAKEHGYYTSQGYQEALRKYRYDETWYYIRECFGAKCQKSWSDAGSLKLGDDNLFILVNNGNGDGEMRFAVLSENEFYLEYNLIDFFAMIDVKESLNIYSYDCGDAVAETLKQGRYSIYSGRGFVAIVKQTEN
jgi:hypothetical protein